MSSMIIGVLKTGHANTKSLSNTIEKLGYTFKEVSFPDEIEDIDRLLLPGVGAFPAVMSELVRRDLVGAIQKFALHRPILGICLGMQLMLEESFEHGYSKGLALVQGSVKRLPDTLGPIPHVGWNDLACEEDSVLMAGIKSLSNAYFVHSFHCIMEETQEMIYTDFYGRRVVAGFRKKHVFGVQFHPEKSQAVGYRVLKNFLEYGDAQS